MQKKFTRQAENALLLAKKTAQSCRHTYIGTEHILMGLLQESDGTAGRILEEFNVDEERLLDLINKLIAPPDTLVLEQAPQYSPRARRLLDLAMTEAAAQKEDKAGTEHLLLAMLKETDSVATRLLHTMGVNIQKLYAAVLSAMGIEGDAAAEEMQAARSMKNRGGSSAGTKPHTQSASLRPYPCTADVRCSCHKDRTGHRTSCRCYVGAIPDQAHRGRRKPRKGISFPVP